VKETKTYENSAGGSEFRLYETKERTSVFVKVDGKTFGYVKRC